MSLKEGLEALTAAEAGKLLLDGAISAEDLTGACLSRIEQRDEAVQAWARLDPQYAVAQAKRLDDQRKHRAPVGALHGLPVGLKDIIDTKDYGTEYGSPIFEGRESKSDATVAAKLRAAGAVILGKTVTTEFAVYQPGKTKNPHDPAHTPGGSSSGSAAAVADAQVPFAVGSQTNGSIIRPASFCGVFGYKPSFGLISRAGVLQTSRPLDTLGVFARTLEDAAILAEALMGHDPADPDTQPRPTPRLREMCLSAPPVRPHFGFYKSAFWDDCEGAVREGFAELAEFLGEGVEEIELPDPFDVAVEQHRKIYVADLALNIGPHRAKAPDLVSKTLSAMIDEGEGVTAVEYNRARDWQNVLYRGMAEVFEHVDMIITPATLGEAPEGLKSTGDPKPCTLWTYLGLPAVSLPLLQGEKGLPIGVQMVGPRGSDGRLLRAANWLVKQLSEDEE